MKSKDEINTLFNNNYLYFSLNYPLGENKSVKKYI